MKLNKYNILLIYFALPIIFIAQNFYSKTQIQKIELNFLYNNWDYRLDTSALGKGGYIMANWIKINGVKIDSIGVKYKGNSSYDSTRSKNPIHIELDTYNNSKNYQNYTDIKLSNCYQDPSMIREVLAFDLLSNYMHAPKANFAQVYINGNYMGVYSNIESINKSFCGNHFFGNDNTFIKANPSTVPSVNTKSNLLKLSGDSSAYQSFYELKSISGWKKLEALCDTVTNKPNNIESILDIDKAIWMLAFNNAIINLDSYSGAFCQNYYLYQDNQKRFNTVVWDLNMSFGGFPFLGNGASSLVGLTNTAMQTLPINVHSTDNYWPLIKIIQNNSKYKKIYAAHLKTFINEQISNTKYLTDYNNYKNLIDTAVISDNKKFFTYAQFTTALTTNYSVGTYTVPGIQNLISARNVYLQSIDEFTTTAPSITAISISTLSNSQIKINCNVTNASTVELAYRFKTDDIFKKTQLFDDGNHNDGSSGDNIFGADITLLNNIIQYYIYAENATASKFNPEAAEYKYYTFETVPTATIGQVVINEFLASNKSDVKNEFHLNEDWIELYNNTNSTLNLSNLYLSNSSKNKGKYFIPNNTVILPKSHLVIWADEINLPTNQLHANFKLNKNGDEIILSDGISNVIDYVNFQEQTEDKSVGRCPDGTGTFITLQYPSFGMYNCVVGIEENNISDGLIKCYPNPFKDNITIETAKPENIKIIDLMGKIVFEKNIQQSENINLSKLAEGVYFIQSSNKTIKLIHFK